MRRTAAAGNIPRPWAAFGDEVVDFKGDAELDKSGDVQTQMGSTDNAISYLDFSHFDDSKFNAIKVEGVEPKSKNVTDDSFKIWATEHMYCAKDADEATKAFLELSRILRPLCGRQWIRCFQRRRRMRQRR